MFLNSVCVCRCVSQDSDLKQYLDNCGNLMSMNNVKVSPQSNRELGHLLETDAM
jgi:hypothetical protein